LHPEATHLLNGGKPERRFTFVAPRLCYSCFGTISAERKHEIHFGIGVLCTINSIKMRDYFFGLVERPKNSISKISKSTYIILYVKMEIKGLEFDGRALGSHVAPARFTIIDSLNPPGFDVQYYLSSIAALIIATAYNILETVASLCQLIVSGLVVQVRQDRMDVNIILPASPVLQCSF
jgi:hypothetical protein